MSGLYYNRSNAYGLSEMEIVTRLFKTEKFTEDFSECKYDLNKIVSYDCKGYDLIGSTCNTHDPNRHCIVKNNNYRVFEVPVNKHDGKLRMTGDFIVVYHNLDFGYWGVAYMKHRFVGDNGGIREAVHFHCFGELELSLDDRGKIHWRCITGEGKCCRGYRGIVFDSDNNRKEYGYHTTWKVINKRYGWTKI